MSTEDTQFAWWSRLRHSGLLLSPVVQIEKYAEAPEEPKWYQPEKLRTSYNRFLASIDRSKDRPQLAQGDILTWVDALLEKYIGHEDQRLSRSHNIPESLTAVIRIGSRTETLRPDRVLFAEDGKTPLLLIKADTSPHIGRGKGRTEYSRFLELLRGCGHRLGLLTNGLQFRLVYAGLDFESWCEWESERWFEDTEGTEELLGLRQTLFPTQITDNKGEVIGAGLPGLLTAIEESRKRQADLSQVLRENVRQAIELLLEDVSNASRTDADLFNVLVSPPKESDTAGEKQLSDAEAQEALLQATVRVVMRMVVCLFAESRGLLPVNDLIYSQAYGVRTLYELLDETVRHEGSQLGLMSRQSAWARLMALFRLVHGGSSHGGFPLRPYGGALFRPGASDADDAVSRALFILEHKVSVNDATIYRVLRKLLRGPLPVLRGRSKTYVEGPVDYTELRTEFIGLIYEGLLDYRVKRTTEETGPQVFLKFGRQPVLPLSRLESMLADDPNSLKDLFTKLKKESVAATVESDDDSEESDDDSTEAEESEVESEELTVEAEEETDQSYLDAVQAARRWARQAIIATNMIGRQRARETDTEYDQRIEAAIDELIDRVVAPGEFYLVRAGNTRKGTGTFYTRPQLAVPTVHRTLEPLCFDKDDKGVLTPKTPDEILALKVCDPACGSASFLVAALHYLTDALYKSLCFHCGLDDPKRAAKITLPFGKPAAGKDTDATVPLPPDDPNRGEDFAERVQALLRRHIVERCIYGVDINPLAIEFARVSLWVETLDPELPFSFLDHKIKVGNALVGCWLDRFEHYPINAWERNGGDDPDSRRKGERTLRLEEWLKGEVKSNGRRSGDGIVKQEMRKVIAEKRIAASGLFDEFDTDLDSTLSAAYDEYETLHQVPISSPPDVREQLYRMHFEGSPSIQRLRHALDEWCSTWFWPASADAMKHVPTPLSLHSNSEGRHIVLSSVRQTMRFFHWELEFPDVFNSTKWGFDSIVGNPPWEILKPNSKEFFADYDPLYPTYDKQDALARQASLLESDTIQSAWDDYRSLFKNLSNWCQHVAAPFEMTLARGNAGTAIALDWKKQRESRGNLYLSSTRPFRLLGGADINSYKMFAELSYHICKATGRMGLVLPSSIHNDKGAFELREALLDRFDCILKLDNENKFFDGLEHNSKFDVVVIGEKSNRDEFDAAFFKHAPVNAVEEPGSRLLKMTHSLVRQVSHLTLSVPEVYSSEGVSLLRRIYDNGILIPDELSDFKREYDITNDSRHFQSSGDLPLYQGAMIWHFDHRYNFWSHEQRKWHRGKLENVLIRPEYPVRPKSWVSVESYSKKFSTRMTEGLPDYYYFRLAYRIQSSLSNQRTFVATIIPRFCSAGNSLAMLACPDVTQTVLMCGLFNSLVYDFVVRTKITSNISKFYIQQLPYPSSVSQEQMRHICRICLSLIADSPLFDELLESVVGQIGEIKATYTSIYVERRKLKAELDARIGHLFGLTIDDMRYMASTFPLVDSDCPVNERQTTLAVEYFEQLCNGDEVVCTTDPFESNDVSFSNDWVPSSGWDEFRISTPRPISESEWRERFPELTQNEQSEPDSNHTGPKDLFGHPIPTDLFGNELRPKKKRRR